jgi:fumarate hydratase, class II
VRTAATELEELALGGTATGTGINTDPDFASRAIARIARRPASPFREADDHFEAQGAKDAAVSVAGALNTVATSLMKIADDIRWLGSGPRRAYRDPAPRHPAGFLHHAGQGESGHPKP